MSNMINLNWKFKSLAVYFKVMNLKFDFLLIGAIRAIYHISSTENIRKT